MANMQDRRYLREDQGYSTLVVAIAFLVIESIYVGL